jgi:hypothetical protein
VVAGGRVDGGRRGTGGGGWIHGYAAWGVRTTEVAAGAALVRAACTAGVVEAAWFAQDAWVVRRAWARSAGGQPGARSALVSVNHNVVDSGRYIFSSSIFIFPFLSSFQGST